MLRTVSVHDSPIEALIVRGRLECEGITAFVAFEHHIWANWLILIALGGVRIQVPSASTPAAADVLAAIRAGEFETALNESGLTDVSSPCPRCGSGSLSRADWPRRLSFLGLLLGVPLPYTGLLMRCEGCGYRWIACKQRGCPLHVLAIWISVFTAFLAVANTSLCRLRGVETAGALCGFG